ncbi:unnamed protein product [Closterium sp. NIES-65]|nr:unnamed protein product [Closterium sp. NIES-65]CAI5964133.1 unnamed protein product [Closterium sp. NIES-65]
MNASAVTTTAPPGPDCASRCVTFVAESTIISPLTFATAVSGCTVLVFVISFAVYLYRRPDCVFLGPDEENAGTSDSQRRVVARFNADFAKPGLDASEIQKLPDCAVCLGEYAAGERIKVVPACAHGFHADCIDLWLAAKTTCPICRRDLRSPATAPAQENDVRTEPGEHIETSDGGEGAESAGGARGTMDSGIAGAEAAAERQGMENSTATEADWGADAVTVRIEADSRDDAVMIVPIAAGA